MKRLLMLPLFAFVTAFGQELDLLSLGPYDPDVPRPASLLGYAIGERHTYHHQMESYVRALAQSSSRVRVVPYGRSYEGRSTSLVIISSEENIQRLEAIRTAVARLKDPRQTTEPEMRTIASSTPAIVWLNYANDGNESAAFEAGLEMSYRLAASEHADIRRIRQQVVTIINPSHNPDSHERFVTWFDAVLQTAKGNPDRAAAEHTGDWLMNANDNHYRFDLNRDALGLTQKETRDIVGAIHHWNPLVFIDHHGNPPIFFFPPTAAPMNLNFPQSTSYWDELIGKAIAAEFDKRGWSFMNREVYDFFYPGYFDTYPALNGATGMTFETDGGGSQGLQLERTDKTRSTLRDAVAKHLTGSYAVLKATAEHKNRRLEDYYLFRKSAIEEGERGPVKQYVLVPASNPDQCAALVSLLLDHQIEVHRARAPFESSQAHRYASNNTGVRSFPSGAYVIPMNQPQKRLIQALLEPDARLPDAFLQAERAKWERNQRLGRRAARERDGFYDITAWSLPLSFGVEAYWTADRAGADARLERVERQNRSAGGVDAGPATYGYLIPHSNSALALVATLLEEDYRLAVARDGFRIGAQTWSPGSFLARVERNPPGLHRRIEELATETGIRVRAVNTPWTDAGITLGSARIVDLKKPRVAIAMYEPTNGRSYGPLWFLFEQVMGYPFTPVRTRNFRNLDLREYDVVIFPDGNDADYQDYLGTAGIARLKAWIDNGGVFVGIKGGAALASRRGVEWTTSRLVGRQEESAREASQQTPSQPAQQPQAKPPDEQSGSAQQPPTEKEVDRTPGAMVRTNFNTAHFLALGYEPEQIVMHNSDLIFTPSREGTHVVTYATQDVRASGFMWPETEKRLAGSPYLIAEKLGRGHVLLFADDPNFRLLWPRLTRLFVNTVFLAPSIP